jgi:hypothetical protein
MHHLFIYSPLGDVRLIDALLRTESFEFDKKPKQNEKDGWQGK